MDGSCRKNSYDELDSAVSMGSGDSEAVVTASLDDPSGTVRYANTDGATFASQYDAMKRLTKQSDALGNTISYTYDPNDRVTSITDPNGQTTQLSYDENGNLAEIRSPKGDQTRWLEYNELGLPQTVIGATDQVTFVEYDEYGRTTGVSSGYRLETLSEDKGIQYSAVDPVFVAYSYDPSGNLIAVQDAVEATTQIAYDELRQSDRDQFARRG